MQYLKLDFSYWVMYNYLNLQLFLLLQLTIKLLITNKKIFFCYYFIFVDVEKNIQEKLKPILNKN